MSSHEEEQSNGEHQEDSELQEALNRNLRARGKSVNNVGNGRFARSVQLLPEQDELFCNVGKSLGFKIKPGAGKGTTDVIMGMVRHFGEIENQVREKEERLDKLLALLTAEERQDGRTGLSDGGDS